MAVSLAACATLPPPTAELSAAQQAVANAADADADQYAAEVIARARDELAQAQAAMSRGRDADARNFAAAASADAELALATSRAATTTAEYRQRRDEVAGLRQRLQLQGDEQPDLSASLGLGAGDASTAIDPAALSARLVSLEADARLSGLAAYERLRAHQALDAANAARGHQRDAALMLAARRIAVAELAARNEALRHAVDRLDRERGDLMVEASRQEAERAREEAERLRVEAQIRAEEAEQLRAAAEAEAVARQQAEGLIQDVGGQEAARLKAAREREAELARKEAELTGAAPKPTPAHAGKAKRPKKTKP